MTKLKANDSELKRVQSILIDQMDRLNNEETMKTYNKREIARSGALCQQASTYVKSVQTQIKIMELSKKYDVTPNELNEYLGIKIVKPEEIAKSKLEKQLDEVNKKLGINE